MAYSIEPLVPASRCEALIRDVNAFVDFAYTKENVRARRAYVFEYGITAEAFAFAVHWPGGEQTGRLPGFALDELPSSIAEVTRTACARMKITTGRVLFNVARYPENSEALSPHYDGELLEFEVLPEVGNIVHRAIRPRKVGLLTLRNDSEGCGTWLHDPDEKITRTNAMPGEFLVFDNTVYQHSVPASGVARDAGTSTGAPRWIRYAIGWRAFEADCFYWQDGLPLRPIDVREAVEIQQRFLEQDWPKQIEAALDRGSFPFPTDRV